MTSTVRIYINSKGVDVPAACTILDAVEAWDAGQADAVRGGERMITDSRGLRTDPASAVQVGAIFRVVRARQEADESADASDSP